MERRVRYTTSADGTSIAWTRFGSGNVDVAWLGGFVGHLEVMFEQPQVERFFKGVPGEWRIYAVAR